MRDNGVYKKAQTEMAVPFCTPPTCREVVWPSVTSRHGELPARLCHDPFIKAYIVSDAPLPWPIALNDQATDVRSNETNCSGIFKEPFRLNLIEIWLKRRGGDEPF
jgi:hypothetical protein